MIFFSIDNLQGVFRRYEMFMGKLSCMVLLNRKTVKPDILNFQYKCSYWCFFKIIFKNTVDILHIEKQRLEWTFLTLLNKWLLQENMYNMKRRFWRYRSKIFNLNLEIHKQVWNWNELPLPQFTQKVTWPAGRVGLVNSTSREFKSRQQAKKIILWRLSFQN